MRAPDSYPAFRATMAERQHDLPPRLKQIASYIALHPEEVAFATVADLAMRADVQPSAVIRFCQAMGFGGYSDLQLLCRESLRGQSHLARLEKLRGDGAGRLPIEGFIDASIASLRGLDLNAIDAAITAATAVLKQADRLQIIGLRRMFSVASYLAYACSSLGLRTQLLDQSGGLLPETAAGFAKGDGLIAVSFAPYAAATIGVAGLAHEAGIPVVSITDSPLSPLAALSRVVVTVNEADHAGFRSLAATITVASALATQLAAERQHFRD